MSPLYAAADYATMPELLVLDPKESTGERYEIDITPFVGPTGPDFGDAAIEAFLASTQQGDIPIDYRLPSRTITVPLLLRQESGVSFEQIRSRLQQKVAIFQREGGWIKRKTPIGSVYADVTNASLKLGGSTAQALWGIDADAVLTLTCLPDWYADEITVLTGVGSILSELTTMIGTPIKGDYPGRVRIIVGEMSNLSQRGMIWAFRSKHYSAANTAKIPYAAEELTPIGIATLANGSAGATPSGTPNNVIKLTPVSTVDWVDVASTTIVGTGDMTHSGTYRIWARGYSAGAVGTWTGTRLRFVYDVGDLVLGVSNASPRLFQDELSKLIVPPQLVSSVAMNAWTMVDLGEIRLDKAPIGVHRWQGKIQALGLGGTSNIEIDKIWVVPVDDGYGVLRASDPTDAVNYASQTLEIRTDGCYRQAANGVGYGPVSEPIGGLPRIPVSGLENRPVEVFLKESRGNLRDTADPVGSDGMRLSIRYQPCYLFVPEE